MHHYPFAIGDGRDAVGGLGVRLTPVGLGVLEEGGVVTVLYDRWADAWR